MLRLLLVVFVFKAVFCATLIDVLQSNGRLQLIKYAKACGLADSLFRGRYTVFAPTDAAFDALGTEQELLLHKEALTSLLLYHISGNVTHVRDVQNEFTIEMLTGQKARINSYRRNRVQTVEGAVITQSEIVATNGVVNLIDRIMLPPNENIMDLLLEKNMTTLVVLLNRANISSILKGNPLTLLAPTNAAFAKLSSFALNKITSDPALLKDILEYHMIPHTLYSAGIHNYEFDRSLDASHDSIHFYVDGDDISVRSDIRTHSKLVEKDISTNTGVIHVIDTVLIPLRYRHTLSSVFG